MTTIWSDRPEDMVFCDNCHHQWFHHRGGHCDAIDDLRVHDDEIQWLVSCNCKEGQPSE